MASKLRDIEKEISALSTQDRAKLAKKILLSLHPKEGDDASEYENLWVDEAERRSEEYRAGKVKGKPAHQVLTELREKYQ